MLLFFFAASISMGSLKRALRKLLFVSCATYLRHVSLEIARTDNGRSQCRDALLSDDLSSIRVDVPAELFMTGRIVLGYLHLLPSSCP